MAGEQKRKERKVLITKALLLGYIIEWCDVDKAFGLWIGPQENGLRVREKFAHNSGAPGTYGWRILNWPAPWLAAKHALEHAGVPDATNVPRNTGTGSGKNWKVRHRRGLRGGSKSLFESDGSP